jgi:hypothetical protein
VELRDSKGNITVSCDASQLTIVVERSDFGDVHSAHIATEHSAAIVVGALGFALGCGYSVEIVHVIEESGRGHVFGVQPTGVRACRHSCVFPDERPFLPAGSA